MEPDVLGRVVTAAPSCSDRGASVLYNEGPRGTALARCLTGDAVAQAAPNVYTRGGATYSSSVRDGALVAFRERVVEQNDRAEVVAAAETADGVVVLCRRSKLLTAAVVECGATTAPRVDPARSVALRGGVAGDVNVASCAGRVFIRKGEGLRPFGRAEEPCALVKAPWRLQNRASSRRLPGDRVTGLRREVAFWGRGVLKGALLPSRPPPHPELVGPSGTELPSTVAEQRPRIRCVSLVAGNYSATWASGKLMI